MDGDDFAIDLLLFDYVQNRFIFSELKVDKSPPRTLASWTCTCRGSSRTSPDPVTARPSASWSEQIATPRGALRPGQRISPMAVSTYIATDIGKRLPANPAQT